MDKDEATNEESLKVEQPAQEPVAFMVISEDGTCEEISHIGHHYDGVLPDTDDLIPLYTHPAQESLKPTDLQIEEWVKEHGYYGSCTSEYHEGLEEGAKWMRDNTNTPAKEWRRLSRKELEKIYGDSSKIDWYAYEAIDKALQKLNHF